MARVVVIAAMSNPADIDGLDGSHAGALVDAADAIGAGQELAEAACRGRDALGMAQGFAEEQPRGPGIGALLHPPEEFIDRGLFRVPDIGTGQDADAAQTLAILLSEEDEGTRKVDDAPHRG